MPSTYCGCVRYVSKHPDYTFYYQRDRDPVPGDEGTVLMLEMVTGRVCTLAHGSTLLMH